VICLFFTIYLFFSTRSSTPLLDTSNLKVHVGQSVIIAHGLHARLGYTELRQAASAGYPRGPELTRKHVGANVEAAPVRCYGSLARTHTRVKDLHGIGVRYLVQRLIRACRKRVPSPFRLNGSNGGDVGHDFRMNDGEYYSPTDPTVI